MDSVEGEFMRKTWRRYGLLDAKELFTKISFVVYLDFPVYFLSLIPYLSLYFFRQTLVFRTS